MTLLLLTIPLMALGVVLAVLPLAYALVREHRSNGAKGYWEPVAPVAAGGAAASSRLQPVLVRT